MNYTPVVGWYYIGADNRTASWTGVEYLYRFLADNKGAGPFAKEVPLGELEIGESDGGFLSHARGVRLFARRTARSGAQLRRLQ